MRLKALFVIASLIGAPLGAQTAAWPDLGVLLFSTLTRSGTAEHAVWLPDHPDPALAVQSLGVAYEHVPGSAGSVSIAVGYYQKTDAGWVFAGPIGGVFGSDPRDPVYQPGTIELTTTMPGPNDPRCCPTQATRWRIDLASRQAQRLN